MYDRFKDVLAPEISSWLEIEVAMLSFGEYKEAAGYGGKVTGVVQTSWVTMPFTAPVCPSTNCFFSSLFFI